MMKPVKDEGSFCLSWPSCYNKEQEPEPHKIEISTHGKRLLKDIYNVVFLHGQVTLVNNLDSDNIICTKRNPKTLLLRLPDNNEEERNNDGDDNVNDRKEDN